jgi:prepilin-type N-terminal cleavage/methylation domain-containing protein
VARGFSLAEMMIALAILAMGLLVIGAALPIGVRYTRDSVNMATGQAAAEYALDLIEQNVCLHGKILNASGSNLCEPGLFQPRQSNPADPTYPQAPGEFIPDYEPVIKVRPLYTQVINATPGSNYYGQTYDVRVEDVIRNCLNIGDNTKECDNQSPPWMRWALPSVVLVYPPITRDTPYLPDDFFGGPYQPRPVLSPGTSPAGAETLKALDRRIAWCAFYRRVSYAAGSDPCLYEFIVVAVRLPSERHRFQVQDPSNAGKADGTKHGARGAGMPGGLNNVDSAAPVPWLVSFTGQLPAPPGGFDGFGFPLDAGGQPMTAFPATLRFTCHPDREGLFPVGTVFIPARNDFEPDSTSVPPGGRVGFGPPAPTALAIYEVVERPNETTVVVKYNGFYPMQGTAGSYFPVANASQWPVWVIPPAYEGAGPGGSSPVVAVARRYVRLREVP